MGYTYETILIYLFWLFKKDTRGMYFKTHRERTDVQLRYHYTITRVESGYGKRRQYISITS